MKQPIYMMQDVDDRASADGSLLHATNLGELSPDTGKAKAVSADKVKVQGALSRAKDTESLRRKENTFFSLFRSNDVGATKSSMRIKNAKWSELNPHFVSKLLVIKPLLSRSRHIHSVRRLTLRL
jgi:hypothetical protein